MRVKYATRDGLARGGVAAGPGVDYITKRGTLVFEPGETRKTVSVPVRAFFVVVLQLKAADHARPPCRRVPAFCCSLTFVLCPLALATRRRGDSPAVRGHRCGASRRLRCKTMLFPCAQIMDDDVVEDDEAFFIDLTEARPQRSGDFICMAVTAFPLCADHG